MESRVVQVELNVVHLLENVNIKDIRRGDVLKVELGEGFGSEQGGTRYCVVIQNDKGNKKSPTIIVAFTTSKMNKSRLPTHVKITRGKYGLSRDSIILLEQVRTIDKKRILKRTGHLNKRDMDKLDLALNVSVMCKNENEVKLLNIEDVKKILGITSKGNKPINLDDVRNLLENPPREKNTLENLPDDIRRYVINKLRFIRTFKESINVLQLVKGDDYSIDLIENETRKEENSLKYFCMENNLNYEEICNNFEEILKDKESVVVV